MTENIEDSSSSNDEMLLEEEELNKFTSTLDKFTPAIPETVTKYYMRQSGLQTEDERVVKLLSVSVQKFMTGNIEK
jgi:transcription initiation factor TFIID subunit 10